MSAPIEIYIAVIMLTVIAGLFCFAVAYKFKDK